MNPTSNVLLLSALVLLVSIAAAVGIPHSHGDGDDGAAGPIKARRAKGSSTSSNGKESSKEPTKLTLFYQWATAFVGNNSCASDNCPGDYLTYVGKAQDESGGDDIAMVRESCTRLQEGEEDWQCFGTYTGLYGDEGILSYTGYYSAGGSYLVGSFVITGGTGQFDGVEGEISDDFSSSFQSNRIVTLYNK